MKILNNDEIRLFLNKCIKNILKFNFSSSKGEFFKIDNNNKFELLKNVNRYNIKDKSIFYNKSLITDNPFFKNIKINNINENNLKFSQKLIPKNYSMNISWIIPDENKCLDDYIVLKACKENIIIPILEENDEIWMSPSLSEQNTINPSVKKAYGNVLTFGLGIGYFTYMCSLKDNVDSITIIELNKNLIDIFKKYILPQFKSKIEIKIIHGDLFNYYNKEFLDKFDYIFVDVWKDNDDGLNILESLFEHNGIYKGNIDYWIEFSCYLTIRFLMISYFNAILNNNYSKVLSSFYKNQEFLRYFKKIHKYFRNIDKTIVNSSDLKNYLYNIDVIREILSQKL